MSHNNSERNKTRSSTEHSTEIDKSGTAVIDYPGETVTVDIDHYWISDGRYFLILVDSDDATPDIEVPVSRTILARSGDGHEVFGVEPGAGEGTRDIDERVTSPARAEVPGGSD